jgi:hypothetical protein
MTEFEQLEVVAAVAGQLLERRDVLGEARAAEADAGLQELRADAVVEARCPWRPRRRSARFTSHTLAISLMNEIFVARNALERELDHLGEAMSVRHERRVRAARRDPRRRRRPSRRRRRLTTRSGSRKS